MLRIKNGRVIDPASGTDARLDVWLDGDRIARIGPSMEGAALGGTENGDTLDATGLIVAPGFIDLHCHLREPGREFGDHRNGHARGRTRRIYRRLPHAEYAPGERQRIRDTRHRRTRCLCWAHACVAHRSGINREPRRSTVGNRGHAQGRDRRRER